MQKSIAEANEGITHAQFVAGAQSGTIGFKCMIGEPRQFLAGAHKAIFSIFVLLYTISPLILVPIWAYHERNAWLLLGIPVSYIASYSAAAHSKLIFLLQVLCIGVWLKAGFSFHQYITFFFFCSLWGYLFFQVAESTQTQHALQALIQHPDVFDRAITQHRIMIVRKEECAISI
ncbi:MAG: hypothetical protein QOF24_1833 [Verrucomicrobiota bacterium]|jgi:hypothetical protein